MELTGLEVVGGVSERWANMKASDTTVHSCRLYKHCELRWHYLYRKCFSFFNSKLTLAYYNCFTLQTFKFHLTFQLFCSYRWKHTHCIAVWKYFLSLHSYSFYKLFFYFKRFSPLLLLNLFVENETQAHLCLYMVRMISAIRCLLPPHLISLEALQGPMTCMKLASREQPCLLLEHLLKDLPKALPEDVSLLSEIWLWWFVWFILFFSSHICLETDKVP